MGYDCCGHPMTFKRRQWLRLLGYLAIACAWTAAVVLLGRHIRSATHTGYLETALLLALATAYPFALGFFATTLAVKLFRKLSKLRVRFRAFR